MTDPKVRATRLYEGLDILTGLWAALPFSYQGKQYNIKEVTFRPTSVQSSRIPIWVGGWFSNKPPLRRAARWDGVCPLKWGGSITPDDGENFWHTFNNIAPVPRPSMPSIQAQHLAIT